jgi:flagellar basal-body rod modification protein FlgD
MSTISSATTSAATTAATTTSKAGTSLQSLNENFDSFLRLLTTQMKNQDPLDPMDNEQMTQQLVNFSQVEQTINMNKNLEQLVSLSQTNSIAANLSYIGREVTASGNDLYLGATDGVTLTYSLPAEVTKSKINILDENQKIVHSFEAPTTAGDHNVVWDGKNDYGTHLSSGTYTYAVINTVEEGKDPVVAKTSLSGKVTDVTFEDGAVTLHMGELTVPMSKITRVR